MPNMRKETADMIHVANEQYQESRQFWNTFCQSALERLEVDKSNTTSVYWQSTKESAPRFGKQVLGKIKWNNGKIGIYLVRRLNHSDTEWVFDYDDKPVYPISKNQYSSNDYYGNVIAWANLKELKEE
jgi:hypothetical protein